MTFNHGILLKDIIRNNDIGTNVYTVVFDDFKNFDPFCHLPRIVCSQQKNFKFLTYVEVGIRDISEWAEDGSWLCVQYFGWGFETWEEARDAHINIAKRLA